MNFHYVFRPSQFDHKIFLRVFEKIMVFNQILIRSILFFIPQRSQNPCLQTVIEILRYGQPQTPEL